MSSLASPAALPEFGSHIRRFRAMLEEGDLPEVFVDQTLNDDPTPISERVELLIQNQVELLQGYGPQDLGESFNWFHAPRGDLQWPTHLSRHYWLLPLAFAYRQTRDERFAAKIVEVLLDWIERFPIGITTLDRGRPDWTRPCRPGNVFEMFFPGYCDGPWTSLSAHVRFDTWTDLLRLIADSESLTQEAAVRILHSLLGDHVQIMLRFPRQMNQGLAIASSLVLCGQMYPDAPVAAEAEAVGWERLGEWVRRDIYPDGSLAECSPNYGMGCVKRLQATLDRSKKYNQNVDPSIAAAIARAARYYAMIQDPLGRSPRLAKGGQSVARSLAGIELPARESMPLSAVFPWAGHAVARSGWDDQAAWVFFDMGPRGSGHHDVAQLGLQLIVDRQSLLVDPGYYSYSSEGPDGRMSNYLKSTAAHNVALVDGQGQISFAPGMQQGPNKRAGDYAWSDDGSRFSTAARYELGFGPGGSDRCRPRQRSRCRRGSTWRRCSVQTSLKPARYRSLTRWTRRNEWSASNRAGSATVTRRGWSPTSTAFVTVAGLGSWTRASICAWCNASCDTAPSLLQSIVTRSFAASLAVSLRYRRLRSCRALRTHRPIFRKFGPPALQVQLKQEIRAWRITWRFPVAKAVINGYGIDWRTNINRFAKPPASTRNRLKNQRF